MANKLRSTTGRISFFAFQDMITTVTGVLLLITLMLTFYLNEPTPAPANDSRAELRRKVAAAKADLEAKLAQLHQQQMQAMALTNRIFVIPEPDPTGKQPILVVLSATNGWYNQAGESNDVEFPARADNAAFRRLLDSWDPAQQRIVFYIRPSGILEFEDCRQLAQTHGFSIGYDAAAEDREYILSTP